MNDDLLRAIFAELHTLNVQTAAQGMFGRGYFSLGEMERRSVDQTVWSVTQATALWATPEATSKWLGSEESPLRPGFVVPSAKPTQEKT